MTRVKPGLGSDVVYSRKICCVFVGITVAESRTASLVVIIDDILVTIMVRASKDA